MKNDPMLWRLAALGRCVVDVGQKEFRSEDVLGAWMEHIGSERALSTDSGAGTCGVTARSERFPCLVTRKLVSDPGLLKHRKCELHARARAQLFSASKA